METKFNFTDNRLRTLRHDGTNKRIIFYDKAQSGLALQLTPTGTKTFQIRTWDNRTKKPVIKTLGKYPTLSVQQAREDVIKLLAQLNAGIDIIKEANNVKLEDSFEKLFLQWLENHSKPHKRSWEEDLKLYRIFIEPVLGKQKISWINSDRIRQWHFNITQLKKQRGIGTVSEATANRCLALVSVIFNQMRPESTNPCKGVKKFREQSRDRFLLPDELRRFFEALEHPDTHTDIRDYLLISIFTGARRSNVLAMKWSDIDNEREVWTISPEESKNSQRLMIPLLPQVIEILTRRRRTSNSTFVFPSNSASGHYQEPKKAWHTLLKRADIKNVRIHDLRRTMGSYQTMTGASTTIVGKTLGHKSQQSTAVYARMTLDPVRDSMHAAVELMMKTKQHNSGSKL